MSLNGKEMWRKAMKKTVKIIMILSVMLGAAFIFGQSVQAKNITVSPSGEKASGTVYSTDYSRIKNALYDIDKAGGGTLTLKSGTYYVTNTLCVGSKTTIKFEKNVTLNKVFGSDTSSTLFQLISFDKVFGTDEVSGYKGEHNIHFNIYFLGGKNLPPYFYHFYKIVKAYNKQLLY